MAHVAIFDINETTLDLGPVREIIDELLGRSGASTAWFGRLLQTSMAVTATGGYRGFGELAPMALEATALAEGVDLPADAWGRVAPVMGTLPAHPDVAEGLERLAERGWRSIALTNSAQAAVDGQLKNAGLYDRFELVLSVEAVRAFKPVAAPYRYALERAAVGPGDAVMVACHDWDLAGAKAVGLTTAFVARESMPFLAAYPPADHDVVDFVELAQSLGDASDR